jgi:hypothetical protein
LNFISTSSSERTISAQIEAISEGKTGILTYTLTSNGVTQTYTTEVIIGPPASHGENGISASPDFIGKVIVVIIVLLVVLYMVFSYLKHKRR